MMNKSLLKEVILEQEESLKKLELGTQRELGERLQSLARVPHTVIIAGLRRVGKSTLLRQIMRQLGSPGYYFNFEDERLIHFSAADFNDLYEVLIELFGEREVFFLDEIQNVEGWERFVRRMQDMGKKFFITGSNASLLSREFGTKLTGRHLSLELYPFSFREFLSFVEYQFKRDDLHLTVKRAALKRHFHDYLLRGGMPEYLRFQNSDVLKKVYDDIIFRDIVARYGVKEVRPLRELTLFLLSNTASRITYNSLKKMLSLGSVNTVKSFLEYLENSFLIFNVPRYEHSLKKQLAAPKKIYCIDHGLAQAVAFRVSPNRGQYLENVVFIELKRQGREMYYYQTARDQEVDFLVREGTKAVSLIQVCHNLRDRKTREREENALHAAMDELHLQEGLILTEDETGTLKRDSKKIMVKPVYQWLLEGF